MLTAAAAWAVLATELQMTATAYRAQVTSLTDGPWEGRSAAAMAAAAARYIDWLGATAVHADQAASHAKSAAAAYETAFASTVPPMVVMANRAQLASLIATNLLGQNTAAIAATEAHYAQMWAQDATAMYGYAAASAAASQLTPFNPPTPATSTNYASAVAGMTSITSAQTVLPQLTSAIPTALQNLATPMPSATAPTSGLASILSSLGLTSPVSFLTPANTGLTATSLSGAYSAWGSASRADANILATQKQISDTENRILQRFDQHTPEASTGSMQPAAVTAEVGRAVSVGKLTTPLGWTMHAPSVRLAALAAPIASLNGSATDGESLFSSAGLASTAIAGQAASATSTLRRWEHLVASTRSVNSMPDAGVRNRPVGIAAELRDLATLRDAHILTGDEFDRTKRRLLGE
jgi:PPE-repeat protein